MDLWLMLKRQLLCEVSLLKMILENILHDNFMLMHLTY